MNAPQPQPWPRPQPQPRPGEPASSQGKDSQVTIMKNNGEFSIWMKKWPENLECPKRLLRFQVQEDMSCAIPLLVEKGAHAEYVWAPAVKSTLLGKLCPPHYHCHGKFNWQTRPRTANTNLGCMFKQLSGHKQQSRENEKVWEEEHARTESFCCPKIKCWGRKRYYSWIKWEEMVKCDIKMQHTGISLPL